MYISHRLPILARLLSLRRVFLLGHCHETCGVTSIDPCCYDLCNQLRDYCLNKPLFSSSYYSKEHSFQSSGIQLRPSMFQDRS